MKSENTLPQHALPLSVLLHSLPGALPTVGFILFKRLLDSSGYPPLLAFLLAVLLVDLPAMWGLLLYAGWKQNGRVTLDGIVYY